MNHLLEKKSSTPFFILLFCFFAENFEQVLIEEAAQAAVALVVAVVVAVVSLAASHMVLTYLNLKLK